MTCPACGFANPEGMKFCGQCGEMLAAQTSCAACGLGNPPGFKFCRGCGAQLQGIEEPSIPKPHSYTPKHLAERILNSRSALEGERKQVTVLFADVKGSMELAEPAASREFGIARLAKNLAAGRP